MRYTLRQAVGLLTDDVLRYHCVLYIYFEMQAVLTPINVSLATRW